MSQRAILILLAAFVVLGAIYAFVTPLFEASDELWHYPMVKTLADGNSLPVQNPANVQAWRQEGSQPPLYYLLMAAATFWINTDDLNDVRFLNPHTDNGLITADRNNNIAIHREDEALRWRGAALAVRLIRLLSVLLGALTVYFTYRLALELMPEQRGLALLAAAVTAFTPMFLFISASVNNDNLAVTLSAATLWLLVRWVKQPPRRLGWQHVALGLLLGAGALSKQSALGLAGLAGGVLVWQALTTKEEGRRQKDENQSPLLSTFYFPPSSLHPLLASFFVVFGLASLVAFWWYFRNWQLYGDWLGWNTFIAIVGARPQPATLLQLWGERVGFVQAYWGLFGGVSVPMLDWTYTTLNVAAGAALIGLGLGVVRAGRSRAITGVALMQWSLLGAWIGLLLWGLLRWTSLTWASQGRLMFPAISAISVLLTAGLAQLSRLFPAANLRSLLPSGFALFLAALSAAVPFTVIAPHYAPPPPLTQAELAALPHRLDADFGGELKLLGYDLQTASTEPGESVRLTLYWQGLIAMDRNWSVFVHVVDEHGVIVAQRDRYPGQGLLATTLLKPGQTWADDYVIPIPAGTLAPASLQIAVGVYDLRDGMRLRFASGGEAVTFGAVALRARAGDAPNPLRQNIGGVLELSGYELDRRALRPGEALTVTLHWRALAAMNANYSVSARVRGEGQARWAAKDAWPQDGAVPTSAWTPGQALTDPYTLTLDPATPPGQYQLEIVVYDSQTLTPLRLWNAEGYPTDGEGVWLSRIRVLP
jgi:hypothetical protein